MGQSRRCATSRPSSSASATGAAYVAAAQQYEGHPPTPCNLLQWYGDMARPVGPLLFSPTHKDKGSIEPGHHFKAYTTHTHDDVLHICCRRATISTHTPHTRTTMFCTSVSNHTPYTRTTMFCTSVVGVPLGFDCPIAEEGLYAEEGPYVAPRNRSHIF